MIELVWNGKCPACKEDALTTESKEPRQLLREFSLEVLFQCSACKARGYRVFSAADPTSDRYREGGSFLFHHAGDYTDKVLPDSVKKVVEYYRNVDPSALR